jgi:hypothetical protein
MTNIRLPNINASTEKEQLMQVKSYLHQLVQELNWALSTIESGTSTNVNQVGTGSAATKQELTTSFNSLKALIIKSSETVMAYSEAAEEQYKSLYVAQSDFGTYTEQASQEMQKNSTAIESFYENMQTILTDIENLELEHSRIDVSANIRSGLLDTDDNGVPVYGVEVGQRTEIDGVEVFDKFARFVSDRLSFFDQNDNEVAYISDRKLYINHVEVTGTFSMGGFVDTVLADKSIVTKWVGG